jgi:hypothetical protein
MTSESAGTRTATILSSGNALLDTLDRLSDEDLRRLIAAATNVMAGRMGRVELVKGQRVIVPDRGMNLGIIQAVAIGGDLASIQWSESDHDCHLKKDIVVLQP